MTYLRGLVLTWSGLFLRPWIARIYEATSRPGWPGGTVDRWEGRVQCSRPVSGVRARCAGGAVVGSEEAAGGGDDEIPADPRRRTGLADSCRSWEASSGREAIMVEFERLGSAWREAARSRSGDLVALSLRLARVPGGPLERRPVTGRRAGRLGRRTRRLNRDIAT
jgi:hypothetical protein